MRIRDHWRHLQHLRPASALWWIFSRVIYAPGKISWRDVKENNTFTWTSNTMDALGVSRDFGWGYFDDRTANITRKIPQTVRFYIWFTKVQDVHVRRETLKVSLKMLRFYGFKSLVVLLRRSSDTWPYLRRKFGIWSYFVSTSKWICIFFPTAPKFQTTPDNIVFPFSLQPLRTPSFKKCSSVQDCNLLMRAFGEV